jgi:hypothetical protein
VELLTITVLEVIVSFVDIGGMVDHHCFRDDCLFCIHWHGRIVDQNSDGQQSHQYQQNKQSSLKQ